MRAGISFVVAEIIAALLCYEEETEILMQLRQTTNDLPMEALGDVLRPSMLGPSSGSGEENIKNTKDQTQYGQLLLHQSFNCGTLMLFPSFKQPGAALNGDCFIPGAHWNLTGKRFLSKTLK